MDIVGLDHLLVFVSLAGIPLTLHLGASLLVHASLEIINCPSVVRLIVHVLPCTHLVLSIRMFSESKNLVLI